MKSEKDPQKNHSWSINLKRKHVHSDWHQLYIYILKKLLRNREVIRKAYRKKEKKANIKMAEVEDEKQEQLEETRAPVAHTLTEERRASDTNSR